MWSIVIPLLVAGGIVCAIILRMLFADYADDYISTHEHEVYNDSDNGG